MTKTRKIVEIIRVTDIYPRHPDDEEDTWHIRVMTPEGPEELELPHDEFTEVEDYLWREPTNYTYLEEGEVFE